MKCNYRALRWSIRKNYATIENERAANSALISALKAELRVRGNIIHEHNLRVMTAKSVNERLKAQLAEALEELHEYEVYYNQRRKLK